MTNWNIEKIREECLLLAGWRAQPPPNERWWARHVGMDLQDPRLEKPDPTRSLDDALPLMEKYEVFLFPPLDRRDLWEAHDSSGHHSTEAASAALVVCLCSLRCAGRDLKEFEA